jgi:hypothetical protein
MQLQGNKRQKGVGCSVKLHAAEKKEKWRLTSQRARTVSIRVFAGVYVRRIYRCYVQAGCYCIAYVKSENKRMRNQDVT